MIETRNIARINGGLQNAARREDVVNQVKRILKGSSRYVLISSTSSTTASFASLESEDTPDEPWGIIYQFVQHPGLPDATDALKNQVMHDLRRFWATVAEHTEETPLHVLPELCYGQQDALQGPPVPSILEVAAELAKRVPDEEWRKVPRDLARNLDGYLYGDSEEKDGA